MKTIDLIGHGSAIGRFDTEDAPAILGLPPEELLPPHGTATDRLAPIATTLGAIRSLHPTWQDAGQVGDRAGRPVEDLGDDTEVTILPDGSVDLGGDELSPPDPKFAEWARGERVRLAAEWRKCDQCGSWHMLRDLEHVAGSYGSWVEGWYCPGCEEERGAEEEAQDAQDAAADRAAAIEDAIADFCEGWANPPGPEALAYLRRFLAAAEDDTLRGAVRSACWELTSSEGWWNELYWAVGWIVADADDQAAPRARYRHRRHALEAAGEGESVWSPGTFVLREPGPEDRSDAPEVEIIKRRPRPWETGNAE